jgi:hypothetical protein
MKRAIQPSTSHRRIVPIHLDAAPIASFMDGGIGVMRAVWAPSSRTVNANRN